jgi:hypothetical protein
MKKIESYNLDEYFRVNGGKYPQSRNTIANIYAAELDGVAATSIIVRWEVNSLQDWQPNMEAIRKAADAWQAAHNNLVDAWHRSADKHGSVDHDGYKIALTMDAVMTNRGTNPTEAVMVADCLAYQPATGEWATGRIYWPLADDQAPDAVDYDAPDDIDLETLTSDPEDLVNMLEDL